MAFVPFKPKFPYHHSTSVNRDRPWASLATEAERVARVRDAVVSMTMRHAGSLGAVGTATMYRGADSDAVTYFATQAGRRLRAMYRLMEALGCRAADAREAEVRAALEAGRS